MAPPGMVRMKCYGCGMQEYKPHSLAGKVLRCKTCGAPHIIKHDPTSGYWVHPVTDWGILHVGIATKWLATGTALAAVVVLTMLWLSASKVRTEVSEMGVAGRAREMVDLWLQRTPGSLQLLHVRYCPSASIEDLGHWQDGTPLALEAFAGPDFVWSAEITSVEQVGEDRTTVRVELMRRRLPEPGQTLGPAGKHTVVLDWVLRDGQWYFDPVASRDSSG